MEEWGERGGLWVVEGLGQLELVAQRRQLVEEGVLGGRGEVRKLRGESVRKTEEGEREEVGVVEGLFLGGEWMEGVEVEKGEEMEKGEVWEVEEEEKAGGDAEEGDEKEDEGE